jgi:hypothetical protein
LERTGTEKAWNNLLRKPKPTEGCKSNGRRRRRRRRSVLRGYYICV